MAHERAPLRLVPDSAAEPVPDSAALTVGARTLGAVELVPGRVCAAVLSRAGEVLRRAEATFDAAGARPGEIDAALARAAAVFAPDPPVGVGVAAAGLVDPATGVVVEVNDAPALGGYPVARRLGELVEAPVRVEHRARLQVLGDRWFGAGRGRRTFASVSTGEVLGVGLLYEGEVVAPPGGRSGAHMTVSAHGERCGCGARGCWKTVATSRWLRRAAETAGFGATATLAGLVGCATDTTDDAAAEGAAGARAVVAEYAANLALGLVNVQQLFAPGLFVLHGEAREGGELFRGLVERELRAGLVSPQAEQPRVSVSGAAVDDVALLGGAGLVLSLQ